MSSSGNSNQPSGDKSLRKWLHLKSSGEDLKTANTQLESQLSDLEARFTVLTSHAKSLEALIDEERKQRAITETELQKKKDELRTTQQSLSAAEDTAAWCSGRMDSILRNAPGSREWWTEFSARAVSLGLEEAARASTSRMKMSLSAVSRSRADLKGDIESSKEAMCSEISEAYKNSEDIRKVLTPTVEGHWKEISKRCCAQGRLPIAEDFQWYDWFGCETEDKRTIVLRFDWNDVLPQGGDLESTNRGHPVLIPDLSFGPETKLGESFAKFGLTEVGWVDNQKRRKKKGRELPNIAAFCP